MRWTVIFAVALALGGCESRRAAREQAREAYVAGQSQTMARQQQMVSQLQHPTVLVQGQVENGAIPWSPDMTMAKAIVAAHYTGFMNPSAVRVLRQGQAVRQFEAVDLLRGQDMPLEPGDVVQLAP